MQVAVAHRAIDRMQPLRIHRQLLIAAAICGFTGVLAGTFGAHGLKESVAADLLAVFETGVRYHLVHAVGLLIVAVLAGAWPHSRSIVIAGWLMTIGVIIFSGSLYLLAITGRSAAGHGHAHRRRGISCGLARDPSGRLAGNRAASIRRRLVAGVHVLPAGGT